MDRNTEQAMNLLIFQLSTLKKEIENAQSGAAIVTLDQTTQGRLSRVDAMQQQVMALSNIERKKILIRKTEAAIDRCRLGTYGICCRCGKHISADRLQYDLATPFCKECTKD